MPEAWIDTQKSPGEMPGQERKYTHEEAKAAEHNSMTFTSV